MGVVLCSLKNDKKETKLKDKEERRKQKLHDEPAAQSSTRQT
jgi:hypothetical protein